jgi:uncharacterized protein YjbJ (UPF0337 family)
MAEFRAGTEQIGHIRALVFVWCSRIVRREDLVNWERIEGSWKQFAGKAREKWGKLTDDDWTIVAGKKDQMVGKIQERYGIKRDEAQKQAEEWAGALKEDKQP